MKATNIGGDMSYWVMVILEAWDIVSEPDQNKKRTLKTVLTPEQAAKELADVRKTILGEQP